MTSYLYPPLYECAPPADAPPGANAPPASPQPPPVQQHRLQVIYGVRLFFRSEAEVRLRLLKKYRRAENILDGTCAALGTMCVGTGAVGTGLLASGVGYVPGLVLEVVTGVAGVLDVAGVAASRRCSAKAEKHEAIRTLALAKLNTVDSHISKALEDDSISDDEFKFVRDEEVKYRAMKEEIRKKMATGSPVLDEETKNELLKRGREQARASIIKKVASAMPRSA